MRWLTNFYSFRSKWTATAAIGIHSTKARLSQLVNFKNAIWTLEERYTIKFCFKLGKNPMREGILCWGFKRNQEEIPSEEASTLQIVSVAFPPGQCTSPQLHPCHRPRWASRQFLTLPIIQTLLPVTFGYSLSSEAVGMRQLRRWKRLQRRSLTRWHKRTSMGLPEVVRTVQ